MITDYKFSLIIRDDVASTTTVTFGVYEGEYQDVTYEDVDKDTKEKVSKTESHYVRTTATGDPLEEYTLTFDGILEQKELEKQINAVMKDKFKDKAFLSEQAEEPTTKLEIKSELKNK